MRYLIPPIFPRLRRHAFTLVELLTVIAVIAILAGLILSISGYASRKAALSRARTEVAALANACESYKADNGAYPHQALANGGSVPAGASIPSDFLYPAGPSATGNSSSGNPLYTNASLELYEALSGDLTASGTGSSTKNYIADLKQDILGRNNPSLPVSPSNTVLYLGDPFGNSYGYSTAYGTAVMSGSTSKVGYNTTFDLWSTGGTLSTPFSGGGATASGAPGDPMLQWVTNW